jgi:hypothetical protein
MEMGVVIGIRVVLIGGFTGTLTLLLKYLRLIRKSFICQNIARNGIFCEEGTSIKVKGTAYCESM